MGEIDISTYDQFADFWMYVYVFISTVIMVNLLVAMFADTYAGVKEMADSEAQAARYRKTFEMRRLVLAVPPPLNLPYVLWALLHHYGARACAAFGSRSKVDAEPQECGGVKSAALENLHAKHEHQYVDRFLQREAEAEAEEVKSLVQAAGERLVAIEEAVGGRMTTLVELLEGNRQRMKTPASDASPVIQNA